MTRQTAWKVGDVAVVVGTLRRVKIVGFLDDRHRIADLQPASGERGPVQSTNVSNLRRPA